MQMNLADSVHDKVLSTLQDLIRINTTNPPGNETACAQYIKDRLAQEGIDGVVIEPAPGRGSVIARLKGDGSARPLLLMSHIDVVPVEPERWSCDPFAAEICDGWLWGRGSIDTKVLTAIQLELMLQAKRMGLALKRDLILAGTADEEAGGNLGMGWLVEHHFDLLDAEYAINEGSGNGELVDGKWVFSCQTAEKGTFWINVKAEGKPGHASTPIGSNAVSTLVAALDRLTKAELPYHLVPTVESYIRAISALSPAPLRATLLKLLDPTTASKALKELPDPIQAAVLRASLHNTAVPTVIRAGEKINVIPSVAEARIDCRLIPGQTVDDALKELRAHLGSDLEIEVIQSEAGTESEYDTELFEIIKNVMSEAEPGSTTLPVMLTAMTDGRFLARKGVKVYGLIPSKQNPGEPSSFELCHGHDERLSLDNLRFATNTLAEIVYRIAAR